MPSERGRGHGQRRQLPAGQPVSLQATTTPGAGSVNLNTSSRVSVETDSRLSLLGTVADATNPLPAGSDFVKRGLGELILAGANTFRGTTGIDEGVLTAMNSQAFGAITGGTVVADGAQVQLQGSLTIAGEPLTVSGSGAAEVPDFPARWFNTGPTPTNNGHSPQNLPTSGRITSVATDPTDPDVIYAAAAGGGLWKTENGGLTWVPLFDGPTAPPAAVTFGGWVAVAPTNPNVVYFGTGEPNGWPTDQPIPGQGNNLADNFAGSGVYRSTDAGGHLDPVDQRQRVEPALRPGDHQADRRSDRTRTGSTSPAAPATCATWPRRPCPASTGSTATGST